MGIHVIQWRRIVRILFLCSAYPAEVTRQGGVPISGKEALLGGLSMGIMLAVVFAVGFTFQTFGLGIVSLTLLWMPFVMWRAWQVGNKLALTRAFLQIPVGLFFRYLLLNSRM